MQIFRGHPAVIMPSLFIRLHHMDEKKIRLLSADQGSCLFCEHEIGIFFLIGMDIGGIFHTFRRPDVADGLPVMEGRTDLSGGGKLFRDSGNGTDRRGVGIGQDAVTLRRHAVKHGGMTGKRDRGKDGMAVQRIAGGFHQLLYKGISAFQRAVRTHTVDGNEDDFFIHSCSLREVLEILPYRNDKQKMKELINGRNEYRRLDRETMEVIAVMTNNRKLMEDVEAYRTGEENYDMCEALKGIQEEGIAIGRELGLEQGLEQGIRGMAELFRELGLPDERIIGKLKEKFSMTRQEAERVLAGVEKE